jgi:hypothetical protein
MTGDRDRNYEVGDTEHLYRVSNNYAIFLNPALVQSWDAFSVHFEGMIGFGRTTYADICVSKNLCNNVNPGRDYSTVELGLGLYLDVNYNYGAGDVTLMAWYAQGTSWRDLEKERVSRNLVQMGDFAPFLVAFNGVSLAHGRYSNSMTGWSYTDADMDITPFQGDGANQFGIGLLGNHAITDDIKLNWGLGYFRLVEAYRYQGEDDKLHTSGKYLGFEADLGLSFQILENLTFETQFGYMWNGDAYKWINGNRRPEGTFAWANFLSVSF